MIRTILVAAAFCVSACAQPPQPVPHADGEIVTRAVQHAQAQVDDAGRREFRK